MNKVKPKVIGQGTYGCVHYPPLLCNGSKERDLDQISKLMETSEANSEMKEYALVSNVDRNKDFYLGQPSLCKVGNQKSNVRSIRSCNMSGAVFENYDDYMLMLMRNGGDSLKIFSENMKNEVVNDSNKKKIQDFWVSCQNLFLGLNAFQKGNIIHHDVKHQNIVYNSERNEVKFIDFGLMTQTKNVLNKIKEDGFWLAMFHWSFPIELGYLNKGNFKKISKKTDSEKLHHIGNIIDDIKKYVKSSNKDTSNVSKESMAFITLLNEVHCKDTAHYCTKTFENIMEDYLLTLKSLNTKHYKSIVEKSYNTVDSYGLGLSLMYVLNRVNKFMDNDFSKELGELFYNMYHPNIHVRYDIGTALMKYEHLINKYILNKKTKEFSNHSINTSTKSKKSIMSEIKTTSLKDISLSSKKTLDILTVDPVRPCPEGKEMNPITNKCIKKCKSGYKRNSSFKCKKVIGECPDGKIYNPLTRRCVNKCKDGYKHDSSFKCKKVIGECPNGKIRNPLTGYCVKKCKDGYSRNNKFRCVKTRKIRARTASLSNSTKLNL